MSKIRKPAEGERVLVKDHWTETELAGRVDWVGSAQFAIEADDGNRYIIPFNGDWKYE